MSRIPEDTATLPGEPGIWVLVLGDMLVFGLFFTTYLYYRSFDVALFNHSQALLDLRIGVLNTLLLLTSSWFVAMGVEAVRTARPYRSRALFGLALVCGLGFMLLKGVEYHDKFVHGITLVTNDFFMYYFMFTGIHLLHVTLGVIFLAVLCRKAAAATPADVPFFEVGATFWHMVDLLWIVLFPLLYLVK